MLRRYCPIVFLVFAVLALSGCAEDGSLLGGNDAELLPTLASIQEVVFSPICAECHISGGTGPMPLDSEVHSYDHLVGQSAPANCAEFYFPRVEPFNPDGSCLVAILEDWPGIFSRPMPPEAPPLLQEQIDAIREWIQDGAPP